MKTIRVLLRFGADETGVASIYMLCLLPLFLMILGFGMDGAAAFRTQNLLQSTADASALAGALQLPTAGAASTTQEGAAVTQATNYSTANMSVAGFGHVLSTSASTNGDIAFGNWNGTTFTTPTPNGSAENAIRVAVKTATANSNAFRTTFLGLIGTTSWDIGASAVAMVGVPKPICILGLHSFQINGGPNIDLQGCSMAVNGPMDCNGGTIGASFAISSAPKPNGNPACGATNEYSQPPTADPYAALASNIPANPCGGAAPSYPQESGGSAPASNRWSGSSWPTGVKVDGATGDHIMCGDTQLTGDVTLNTSETLVIEDGQLDIGSHSLTTSGGGSLTVIFTGPTNIAGLSPTRTITGSSSGSVNITGPSSGTWKQMAIYQDPNVSCASLPCSGEGVVEGGQGANSGPIWDISGIVYLPNAQFQINGLVSPASSAPNACITLVAYDLSISGGGDILAEPACTNAPTTLVPISRLVQ